MHGRATIRKSDGTLIEFQSGNAPLGTLKQNAINAGIPDSDIEERYISKEELDLLLPKPPAPVDYKAKYQAATTLQDKIDVIAQALNLTP